MRIEAENDTGPFETLFSAFQGYNVRITTTDGVAHEVCLRGPAFDGGPGVHVQAFVGDEDEASGDHYDLAFESIEEVLVY